MSKVDKYRAQFDKLKRQLEQGGIAWWKPIVGKNMIRILPDWTGGDDVFYKRVLVHWNCGEKGRKVVCRKILGEDEFCPICDFVEELLSSNKPEDVRYGEAMGQTERFVMNILDSKDWDTTAEKFEKGAQVFECGRGLFQNILWMFTDGEYGELDDWDAGRYILIERQGTGMTDTKYSLLPAGQITPIDKDAVIETVNDLDELNKPFTSEQMIAILEGRDPKEVGREVVERDAERLVAEEDAPPVPVSRRAPKPVAKTNGAPPSMEEFTKENSVVETPKNEPTMERVKPVFSGGSEVTKRLERLKKKQTK